MVSVSLGRGVGVGCIGLKVAPGGKWNGSVLHPWKLLDICGLCTLGWWFVAWQWHGGKLCLPFGKDGMEASGDIKLAAVRDCWGIV